MQIRVAFNINDYSNIYVTRYNQIRTFIFYTCINLQILKTCLISTNKKFSILLTYKTEFLLKQIFLTGLSNN